MLSEWLAPSPGGSGAAATRPDGSANAPGPRTHLDVPTLFTRNITLKQFLDPEQPTLSCYTALVNSAMGVQRLNGSGLLGDWDLLRGDPSGGYSIRIHRYAAQPIIETLGIEVGVSNLNPPEGAVTTLKPSFPFWMDVDLYYGAGEVICSRVNQQEEVTERLGVNNWLDERTQAATSARRPARGTVGQPAQTSFAPLGGWLPAGVAEASPVHAATAATHDGRTGFIKRAPNVFSKALGRATQPVAGPFHFPQITLQVYPLLADRARLDRLIDRCWNRLFAGPPGATDAKPRLETCGSYVYMVVTSNRSERGTNWSGNNDLDWWADHEVSFCVPVKWYRDGKLISLAVIEPFIYADNYRAVITDREVNGRNTVMATIESPKDAWISPGGPASSRRLVHVATEIYPVVNVGMSERNRTLLEIDERDVLPSGDSAGWRGLADSWGRDLVDDLKRKTWLASTQVEQVKHVKALALEILAHKAPINRLTLKQYRDANDIDRACYQAAVHTERSITRIYDVREIEQRVHIRVHRIPGHPIIELLGLKHKTVESAEGNVVDTLQPIRPFWMNVAIKEELGIIIGRALRAVEPDPANPADANLEPTTRWEMTHPWFSAAPRTRAPTGVVRRRLAHRPYFDAPGRTRVSPSLVDDLASGNGQNIRDQAEHWLRGSLTNELAMMKMQVDALSPHEQEKLDQNVTQIDRTMHHFLDSLRRVSSRQSPFTASSFRTFCDGLSLDQMDSLIQAIDAAFGQPDLTPQAQPAREQATRAEDAPKPTPGMPDRAESSRQEDDPITKLKLIMQWVMTPPGGSPDWAAFVSEDARASAQKMHAALGTIGAFDHERLRLLKMTLPLSMIEALNSLIPAGPGKSMTFTALQQQYDDEKVTAERLGTTVGTGPTAMLTDIANELDVAVKYWSSPDQYRRLSREEAAKSVQTLGDLQVVVESILSDEWENHDPVPRTRLMRSGPHVAEKPAHCFPVGSVGPLGEPHHPWARRHGLERWPGTGPDRKGVWVFVAKERTPT
jgi:hypothetical protein